MIYHGLLKKTTIICAGVTVATLTQSCSTKSEEADNVESVPADVTTTSSAPPFSGRTCGDTQAVGDEHKHREYKGGR